MDIQEPLLHEARGTRGGVGVLRRFRAAGVALAISIAVHALIVTGLPHHEPFDRKLVAAYTATLEPAAVIVPPPVAAPAPAPRPVRPKSKPKARTAPPDTLASLAAAEIAVPPAVQGSEAGVAETSAVSLAEQQPLKAPELLALAQPATPIPALEPPKFPVEALPASLSIDYQINSAFADGRATYEWRREGDSYRISGEAEATGFFTLFLEGRILQESLGTVTAGGLRPEQFRERKPQGAPEGLDFDWVSRQVTFDRGDERRTTPLTDNTVDWLSMIFQLAHMPPATETIDMQVFTQRKMYRFTLKVLGVEDIDIPMGRVKALHLRHSPTDDKEAVDVWLGVNQHHLPVKMRYPVARNRLMVEQVATRVTLR
jgi:hypothetical protein